jgi:hypothetical protein
MKLPHRTGPALAGKPLTRRYTVGRLGLEPTTQDYEGAQVA